MCMIVSPMCDGRLGGCVTCYSCHRWCRYRCLQNQLPLLMRPPLHARSSPLVFHLRPAPSWSAKACKISAQSRHETPHDDIPVRTRGMYCFGCARFSLALITGVYFANTCNTRNMYRAAIAVRARRACDVADFCVVVYYYYYYDI